MRIALVLLALCALALPQASAASADVLLQNGVFQPDRVGVSASDTLRFVNDDDRAHTVTSSWDAGATLDVVVKPGQWVPVIFHAPGTYALRCVPHSADGPDGHIGMVLNLQVAAPAEPVDGSTWGGPLALLMVAGLFIVWSKRAGTLPRLPRG